LIYSYLIASTGWTWDYIDANMTLPRLYALSHYWNDNPPLHILVAAFLNVKPKVKAEEQSIDQLFSDFAAAGLTVKNG
jgi:hypothetical protein